MKGAAEVLVVGGGVTGLACAYFLVKAGVRVTLLEAGDLGHGSSGACDGFVHVQTKRAGLHTRLARKSVDLYRQMARESGCDWDYQQNGGLVVSVGEEQREWLRHRVRVQRHEGVDVELVTPEEARALEPSLGEGISGAAFGRRDGQIDPWKVLYGLEQEVKRLGGTVRTGAVVRGFETKGDAVRAVRTSAGTVACSRLLLAPGSWARPLGLRLGLKIPVWPRKGQVLVTEAVTRFLTRPLNCAAYVGAKLGAIQGPGPTGAGPMEEVPAGLSLEQTAAGNLLVGSTREWAGFDTSVTLRAMQRVSAHARALVPELEPMRVIRAFAGLRPYTPDGLPLLGLLPGWSNAYIAAGHEGDGVALAPITGRLVQQLITGEPVEEPSEPLVPGRFS